MQVRFVLGPAGCGKTFRCLAEIRQTLRTASDEALVLLAPKQTTYQLERQLLADTEAGIPGFTRLHILSFDRLARFVLERMQCPPPRMLSEEGRVMVLRSLLTKKRDQLKVFRASAKLTGFAQQLSLVLGELQRNQLTPETLLPLSERLSSVQGLASKLQDFSALLQEYLAWLEVHHLHDPDSLLASVTKTLLNTAEQGASGSRAQFIEHIWVDGFAEWSIQELDFLAALLPRCGGATLTFCLDRIPNENLSWLSTWASVQRAFLDCKTRLAGLADRQTSVELLSRDTTAGRFSANRILKHLEQFWADPTPWAEPEIATVETAEGEISPVESAARLQNKSIQLEWLWPDQEAAVVNPGRSGKRPAVEKVPVTGTSVLRQSAPRTCSIGEPNAGLPKTESSIVGSPALQGSLIERSLRVVSCADTEAEATYAAREILRHVHAGGRYREITVLVRKLAIYHEHLQRVFSRYGIPFFMDRRESVSHHPLAELTRSALRTVSTQWKNDEWFAALKSGLVPAQDEEIDRLENEAMAYGWNGLAWLKPLSIPVDPESAAKRAESRKLEEELETLRQRLLPPFERLAVAVSGKQNKPTGPEMAAAIRALWDSLHVEETLQEWAAAEPSSFGPASASVHATVWAQMNAWLENLELAFVNERLNLREWLPILEAGLGNLTVGAIPPALDQVLIGSVDRLRNPDVKLVLLLGLNEGVFPARPEGSLLLTESDRTELEKQNIFVGTTARHQLSRERYLAYIACTRARERLVLTSALQDANGAALNPSPFLSTLRQLFPSLKLEAVPRSPDWRESEHPLELVGPMLRATKTGRANEAKNGEIEHWARLAKTPALSRVMEQIQHFHDSQPQQSISSELVNQLYGPVLRTSVSRLEQFAACPFRFFVHSGLRAEERRRFELDFKEQGTFQHDVLALFHEELEQEGKRWRDITPQEARDRIARIAKLMATSFRQGLFQASDASRFTARVLTETLQDFVETLIGWMREQYRFDPVKVELPFGADLSGPAWEMDLGNGQRMALQGRIDRVDLFKSPDSTEALCVVVDYKSRLKKLDPVLIANGIQLQLLGYLNVLRHWPNPEQIFGVKRLIPAGVFYVNLRGWYPRSANRSEALGDTERARKFAYRHSGRFDFRALRFLDQRPDASVGDQFFYRLTKAGQLHNKSRDALASPDFQEMIRSIEATFKDMGQKIYAGNTEVAPYHHGPATACDYCQYAAICRIDPWTHPFRVLADPPA